VVSLDVFDDGDYSATYSAKASGGVATFSISVPADESPGSHFYSMDASVDSETSGCNFDGDSRDFTALTVPAGQPIAPCPDDVTCVQVTNGGNSAATLFADNGSFDPAAFESYDGNACGTPADAINGVLNFGYSGGSPKTIVFALGPSIVTKGIGLYKVCWQSPTPFTVLGGGTTAVQNGNGYFFGDLPACKNNSTGPCVLFKTSTQYNGAFIGVLAPANDPKGFAY
jgi:hypothetical protein